MILTLKELSVSLLSSLCIYFTHPCEDSSALPARSRIRPPHLTVRTLGDQVQTRALDISQLFVIISSNKFIMRALLNRLSESLGRTQELMGNEIASFSENGCILVISDEGGKSSRNDDCAGFHVEADETLLALADGIGSGGWPSRRAAKLTVNAFLDPSKTFPEAAKAAHSFIQALPGANANRNVGAVAAVARIEENRLTKVHLGDARIYIVRSNAVIDQSVDHVALVPSGALSPLSAISSDPSEDLSRFDAPSDFELQEGDLVLLISDGLHHENIDVEKEVIAEVQDIIATHRSSETPDQLALRIQNYLRTVAIKSGDNISLILYSHKKPLIPVKKSFQEMAGAAVSTVMNETVTRVGCAALAAAAVALPTSIAFGALVYGGTKLAQEVSKLDPSDFNPFGPDLDGKALYKNPSGVCADSIPGTWILTTHSGKALAVDMSTYAGHSVDMRVGPAGGTSQVLLEDYPGECLVGKAPRSVAAKHPTKKDRVTIQDGAVTSTYHFQPRQGSANAIQGTDSAVSGDLDVQIEGSRWLHCGAPVSLGCSEDAADIKKAYADFEAAN